MRYAVVLVLVSLAHAAVASAQSAAFRSLVPVEVHSCDGWDAAKLQRNPTAEELRCWYGMRGPGRFGLSDYMEVPVYQPATPLPGTHVVGVPGLPRPAIGESYEEWEWRVLRTQYGREVLQVHRGLELLDPLFAERLLRFERRLAEVGIRAGRRETWRSWDRQAYLFQQGRSRAGAFVTTTLTSWHCQVDARGHPASRAADYNVAARHLPRFHEIAWEVGLESYGPDSNDPGHVYLPVTALLAESELRLLRLLPRVPGVTLATGRPTDEYVPPYLLPELRSASTQFASEPFFPSPAPRLRGTERMLIPWVDSVTAAPVALEVTPVRRSFLSRLLKGSLCLRGC